MHWKPSPLEDMVNESSWGCRLMLQRCPLHVQSSSFVSVCVCVCVSMNVGPELFGP